MISVSSKPMRPITNASTAPSRTLVEYEKVKFTGTARFTDDGTAYRTRTPNETQYFGKPSRELDQAWDDLIGNRFFYITDKEAQAAFGPNFAQYHVTQYGINSELDVMHTLHCVNQVRQAVDSEYYRIDMEDNFMRYHIDHCLDIIRQAIQCKGDLTIIPTRWFDGIHKGFIDSDQTHTCRNFEKIREWTIRRHNSTPDAWRPPMP
ncbi:hypothetical protein K431DRAFT_41535, partial [Polychaeton citri CBS 116435]